MVNGEPPDPLQVAEERLRAGDVEEAERLFREALERDPKAVKAYIGLARIALWGEDVELGGSFARAAVELDPRDGEAATTLGLVLETRGDMGEALKLYGRGAELAPDSFLSQYNFGRALVATGQHRDAIRPLRRAGELDPKSGEAFFALGNACQVLGKLGKAVENFRRARENTPKDPAVHLALAEALFESGDRPAARAAIRDGLDALGENPSLLEKGAAIALAMGDFEAAVKYSERETLAAPDYQPGWVNFFTFALLAGDPEKSEEVAKRALVKHPGLWQAWYHLGGLYEGVKLDAEAEAAYRKAAALAPEDWKILSNLGLTLADMEDPAKHRESAKVLERASELAPRGEWKPHYNLACAWTKIGERKKALRLVRTILEEASPGDEVYEHARVLQANLTEEILIELTEVMATGSGKGPQIFDTSLAELRDDLATRPYRFFKNVGSEVKKVGPAEPAVFHLRSEPGAELHVKASGPAGRLNVHVSLLAPGGAPVEVRDLAMGDTGGRTLLERNLMPTHGHAFLFVDVRRK